MDCVCRLRELSREIDTARKVKFEDSTDRMPPTLGRGSKKGDIYQLVRQRGKEQSLRLLGRSNKLCLILFTNCSCYWGLIDLVQKLMQTFWIKSCARKDRLTLFPGVSISVWGRNVNIHFSLKDTYLWGSVQESYFYVLPLISMFCHWFLCFDIDFYVLPLIYSASLF